MARKTIKLGYMCTNNGDGSVSVHFYPSLKDAELAEEFEKAHMHFEGWGEDSASELKIVIDLNTGEVLGGDIEDMTRILRWVEDGKPQNLEWDAYEE